ncbi:hypothetical protein [Pontimicrobium aquaticum]|uniref:DUF4760 domain-containing protein n=1 Tax=Pontimicrobium aquaticum TaxID=2565367 RepID=A0A4U0F108_9FLAO|nr:hypothetical protein [Pontimicrobium aquaticum]TJY37930.1 hypothetical protein E5167_01350 [Pontimicrobium aquaticum]
MSRIINRWYIGLIFIPVIITYSTNYFKLPDILANWKDSLIATLTIIISILVYELYRLNKKHLLLKLEPNKRDQKVIKKLLNYLDLDSFQEDIYKQDAWYGYKDEAIYKTTKFYDKVRLIKNKISDPKLNVLLNSFTNELKSFHEYSSMRLSGDRGYLKPFKDTVKQKENAKQQTAKMNKMTKSCFEKLDELIKYLIENKYL